MKVKMNLYISDPERFARDPLSSYGYALSESRHMDDEWIFCGEVEFNIDVNSKTVIEAAKADLNIEIGKHTAAINVLETRKAELLAIGYDQPQQDRTLSSGKIKTATGDVVEPTCTDIRDMDGFGRDGF